MIRIENGEFRLSTKNSSYCFRITRYGHLEHICYGARVREDETLDSLCYKNTAETGSSVLYRADDPLYALDTLPLEYSGIGKGDFRHTPMECEMPDGSYVCDFVYLSHELISQSVPMRTLPGAHGASETLRITLLDEAAACTLSLYYTLFEDCDCITRRAVLQNNGEKPLKIRRLMSFMLDMEDRNYRLLTLSGGWIREAHARFTPLPYGVFVNESTTGASSNRHNPSFALAAPDCSEESGEVYGFNLVYSGNHYAAIERGKNGLVRVMQGINPLCFSYTLKSGESFETPEAVLSYSNRGMNGLRERFHDFVNHHIIPPYWDGRERPVLFNNWEACFFRFNERRLLQLAKESARLGAELFVLDDGWFGARESDRAGLGDYSVNRRKLPRGLFHLAKKVKALGMDFGLWFEPEMCNENSELYRAHSEYCVAVPGRKPSEGRHQLVLDLTNPEVRDYIVRSVSGVLDSTPIAYVKWDMNRHMSDMYGRTLNDQGEFFHRYIMGLYEVLSRIFTPRPELLLESCSSGGNRFDLGMLCFSPQIWASDDTDPVERLCIQGGLSYFYPPSTMGAHVSLAPHQQTLRATPLNTRFNVSCFGVLGYELDLAFLTCAEKQEIKRQIAFYKEQRRTLQFGRFSVLEGKNDSQIHWQVSERDQSKSIAGFFQKGASAAHAGDVLPLTGLDKNALYRVETREQPLFVRSFGALVNHLSPQLHLRPNGFLLSLLDRFYTLSDAVESYRAYGDTLMRGVKLSSPFLGTNYNANTRLLGDYGSNLYLITKE